ncbi:transcription antitermination factor NusB [Humidesulfovibrio sp.]|uniref:transcription antitermination factor NusB n=1 Tax=Humidesulfovibrio sp. TaxID=2910988 RepID=UPI0039C8BA29
MTTTDKRKGTRRQGRTLAFQVLFGIAFDPHFKIDQASLRRTFADNPAVMDNESEEAVSFASQLFMGICEHLDDIDKVIGKHSDHWKIGRIGKVELAILRLALFEILHRQDIPLKVAINEAIELAKAFGDENSRAFVNGILDAVARAVDQGRLGDLDKKMDMKPDAKTAGAADKKITSKADAPAVKTAAKKPGTAK